VPGRQREFRDAWQLAPANFNSGVDERLAPRTACDRGDHRLKAVDEVVIGRKCREFWDGKAGETSCGLQNARGFVALNRVRRLPNEVAAHHCRKEVCCIPWRNLRGAGAPAALRTLARKQKVAVVLYDCRLWYAENL
jgi:hypothetical protein